MDLSTALEHSLTAIIRDTVHAALAERDADPERRGVRITLKDGTGRTLDAVTWPAIPPIGATMTLHNDTPRYPKPGTTRPPAWITYRVVAAHYETASLYHQYRREVTALDVTLTVAEIARTPEEKETW
jgi:hypothetical protein